VLAYAPESTEMLGIRLPGALPQVGDLGTSVCILKPTPRWVSAHGFAGADGHRVYSTTSAASCRTVCSPPGWPWLARKRLRSCAVPQPVFTRYKLL